MIDSPKWRRLAGMGIDELTVRGRQATWTLLERFGVAGGARPPRDATGGRGGSRARPDPLARFRETVRDRFFPGACDAASASVLRSRLPRAAGALLAAAESVCAGRFDLLGYRGLRFGDPIDWHLDPVSGRRSPPGHWSRLDPLDASRAGDSKVVWELNRHQWMVILGQAYRLTGEERFAQAFAPQATHWIEVNPPQRGINWASSLEAALRLISWTWTMALVASSQVLTAAMFARLVWCIEAHARHIERHLSRYFSPNTHLTGEALGLFYAGAVFPWLRGAARWRALGARILGEQSERQVLPDGVHFELSTCYQRYTAEFYLHFLILARRQGIAVPAPLHARLERLIEFLLAVRRPDGSVPSLGDDDGGALLPLALRPPGDFRGLFALAAAFLGRADFAWAAGGPAPEVLWVLGPRGLESLEALDPAPPASAPSRLFPSGGYAVMRSGWDRAAHHAILDAGPLGCSVSGGHGHADLLSIQCSAFGEPFLVDPGTGVYAAGRPWRDHFRSSAAHSTVEVDGRPQAVPEGPFRWRHRPAACLRRFVSTEHYDYADADHDAYGRLPDPVRHRRRVIFARRRYWVLVDDLEGEAEHRIELRFQFAPLPVSMDDDSWARARGAGGGGLLLRAFARIPLQASLLCGESAPFQGWISPAYGRAVPAPLLVYRTQGRLPLRIVTLLYPIASSLDPPPRVRLAGDSGSAPDGLALAHGDGLFDALAWGDDGVVLRRA